MNLFVPQYSMLKKYGLYIGLAGWAIIALCSVRLYPKIFSGVCFFQSNWIFCDHIPTQTQLILSLILIIGFIIAGIIAGCSAWQRLAVGDTARVPLIVPALFFVLAFLIVPFGSGDVSYYYSSSYAINHGVNPFVEPWSLVRPFVANRPPETFNEFSYGPIAADLFAAMNTLSAENPAVFIVIWKIFVGGILVIAWALTVRLVSLLGAHWNLKSSALWWFAQPIFLFEVFVNGHFDVVWLVPLLLATIYAIRGRWWAVFPLLTLGVWIKFIPLLMMPFFVLWWWQKLTRANWRSHIAHLLVAGVLSILVTVISWWPYWRGFAVFHTIILQSKWAVMSVFAVVYYSLRPLFDTIFGSQAHWYLTRLAQGGLLALFIWSLWPVVRLMYRVVLRQTVLSDVGFVQLITVSMLFYLSLWQKSFWPWYVIWLVPLGLVIVHITGHQVYRRIFCWLSLVPLVWYIIWLPNWIFRGVDIAGELWFWWLYVLLVWAYPLWQLYTIRKHNFLIEHSS